MQPQVIFYHTSDCHLCELAEAIIEPVFVELGWVAEVIDVAEDMGACERFGDRIPVLYFADSDQALCWPFTSESLQECCAQWLPSASQ